MRPGDIRELLRNQPFCPFRLQLGPGTFFAIRHPEMVVVSGSAVHIDLPSELGKKRRGMIALVQIRWIEIFLPE